MPLEYIYTVYIKSSSTPSKNYQFVCFFILKWNISVYNSSSSVYHFLFFILFLLIANTQLNKQFTIFSTINTISKLHTNLWKLPIQSQKHVLFCQNLIFGLRCNTNLSNTRTAFLSREHYWDQFKTLLQKPAFGKQETSCYSMTAPVCSINREVQIQ